MQPHTESTARKNMNNRQWRFTEKPSSPNSIFHDYKSVSPKYQHRPSDQPHTANQIDRNNSTKQLQPTQTAEIQRLISYLSEHRTQYPTLVGPQIGDSHQPIDSIHTRLQDYDTDSVLRSILHAGEQYRRELIRVQQRKNKGTTTNAVVKKQIDNAYKERESLQSENILLKSQKSLLEKELLIVRDNADRMKRKFELDLHQSNSQLEEMRNKNEELESIRKQLIYKLQKMTKLQEEARNYQRTAERNLIELHKVRSENQILNEKFVKLQLMYDETFLNYSKLQVQCQGLQKEVAITKNYLTNTQTQLNESKEHFYVLQDQKTRGLQEKNKQLLKKNNEVVLLLKKVQELGVILQAREKTIAEYELLSAELNRKLKLQEEETKKIRDEVLVLTDRATNLQTERSINQEQIRRLSALCRQQQLNCQKSEKLLVKIVSDEAIKEQQLTIALKNQLQSIVNDYQAKIDNLETILQNQKVKIKNIELQAAELEQESSTIKQINQRLNEQIFEYSKQVKEKTQAMNGLKSQVKALETKKEQLSKILFERSAQANKIAEQSQILRQNNEELQQLLKKRQADIIKFQLQAKKQSQQAVLLAQARLQREADAQQFNQLLQELRGRLTAANTKNSELSSKSIAQSEQISQSLVSLQDMKTKIDRLINKNDQIARQNLSLSQRYQVLNQQKNLLVRTLEEKQRNIQEYKLLIEKLQRIVAETQGKCGDLDKKLREYIVKLQNMKNEREGLSKVLSNKSSQNEKLKLKLIEIQQTLQDQFLNNIETVKLQHKKSLSKLDQQKSQVLFQSTQRERLKQQIEQQKQSLSASLKLIKAKHEQTAKQKQAALQNVVRLQETLSICSKELQEKQILIQKLEKERNLLAGLNQERSKFVQKLKKQILIQQEEMKENFLQSYTKVQNQHKVELQTKIKQIEDMQNQIQILELFKIKAGELENQVLNLSEMLKLGRINLQSERSKNKNISEENDMLKRSIKEIQEQLTSRYEGEILNRSERFDREYSNLSQETAQLRSRSHSTKEELEGIKRKLQEKQGLIQGLRVEIQSIKQKAIQDIQTYRTEIQHLRKSNVQMSSQFAKLAQQIEFQRNQRDAILKSAITFQRSNNAIVQKVSHLEKQFSQIHQLLTKLKDERQILIKKYISLANVAQKSSDRQALSSQIDSIGQHFTRVSLLHGEISKRLGSSKVIVEEVQRSKVVGLNVISSAIVSSYTA